MSAYAPLRGSGDWLASRSLMRAVKSAYAPLRGGSGGQPSRGTRAKAGEPPRNRTENPQIMSLLLCQLS